MGSTPRRFALRFLVSVLGILVAALAAAATPDQIARIDARFRAAYPASGPGAAVIVVQDGKTVLRAGYGFANVELGVPVRPDMVFRVGSATKQFTSACILKLVEQGKLRLDDPISKYFPDYPAAGRTVTLEQLLTHTSGIRSATDMPAWYPHMREDWTVSELIDFFKNEPLDFAPGSRWHYSNSGYILLGAILEKVTGRPYEEIVADWIFRPLGMKNTRYGSEAPIIPGRADGYRMTPDGVINAPYLSMTQPFSAGALVSTVDDLARWQSALDRGEVLSAESRRRMWTPVVLPDGRSDAVRIRLGHLELRGTRSRRARRNHQRILDRQHATARRQDLRGRAVQLRRLRRPPLARVDRGHHAPRHPVRSAAGGARVPRRARPRLRKLSGRGRGRVGHRPRGRPPVRRRGTALCSVPGVGDARFSSATPSARCGS